jgi:hypothetical protein
MKLPMKLFILGIIGIFIFFLLTTSREQKFNQVALENLNLKLSGVVLDVNEVKGLMLMVSLQFAF